MFSRTDLEELVMEVRQDRSDSRTCFPQRPSASGPATRRRRSTRYYHLLNEFVEKGAFWRRQHHE
jgi:hypothetical protein